LGSEGNICNISNYTAGGFYVYCYLGNDTTSRTYQVYATATYSDGYTETIYSGYLTTGATPPAYRSNGLILSIMIIGLFAISGAYYGGVVSLAMTGLALFLTKLLGWLPLDNGAVMLVIAMIVVIYVIGRRSGVVR
jgi:hypothetical protein